jgi:sugar lactone lactonase YvrE
MLFHPTPDPRPLSGIAFDAGKGLVAAENHFHKVLFRITGDGLLAPCPSRRWPIAFDNDPEEPFGAPSAVATDAHGNVYAVNSSRLVCKISGAGVATSLIERSQWPMPPGHKFRLYGPRLASVVVDGGGTLFLADELGLKVYTLTPGGDLGVLIDFNSPEVLLALAAGPDAVAVSPFIPSGMAHSADGTLYVAGRATSRDQRIRIRVLKFLRDRGPDLILIEDDAHEIPHPGSPPLPEPSTWPKHVFPHGLHPTVTYPVALAVDRRDNLFIADYAKNLIRKVDPSGSASHFVGSGRFEVEDGFGSSASLRQPRGIAVDECDCLYVQDPDPHVIRRVSSAGEVKTLRFSEAEASFHQPMGVAVDSNGAVYVADTFNSRVCKVLPSGATATLARSGAQLDNRPGYLADFGAPCALTVDGIGNVYVCGRNLYRISQDGVVNVHAGRMFVSPLELPIEPCDGPAEVASFSSVRGMDVDSEGNIYLVDGVADGLIRVVSSAGEVRTLARLEGAHLMGLALGADGWIYVSSTQGFVQRFFPGAQSEFTLDKTFVAYNTFGLAADADGAVYVALTHPSKVMVRHPDGTWNDLAGSEVNGAADGPSDRASFSRPIDVAVDRSGIVYVADSANNLIRKIDKQGTVSTLAGSGIKGDSDSPIGGQVSRSHLARQQ